MRRIAVFTSLILMLLSTAAVAAPFDSVIKKARSIDKYIFYLHGGEVGEDGTIKSSPRYGLYMYDRIVQHYEARGLKVIDQIRTTTNHTRYAAEIVKQVRQLKAKGVPSQSITVAGFSEGGYIALLVASSLGDPDVGYVIMAGCGKGAKAFGFDQFLKRKRGSRLQGRIFSILASNDMEAGSCRPAVEQASGKGLAFRETRVKTGKGHGLFYQPRPEWIEPTAIFAKGGR